MTTYQVIILNENIYIYKERGREKRNIYFINESFSQSSPIFPSVPECLHKRDLVRFSSNLAPNFPLKYS